MKVLPFRRKPYIITDGKRIDIYHSSSYMCITSSLAKYALKRMNENKQLMKYLRLAYVPEELVIPTIAFNSDFSKNCMLYPKHQYDGLKYLSAITYFNYGKIIQVFTLNEYDELMASGKMFARKLATGVSDALMDRLDKEHGIKN